ncbi:MAG: hypothetical protein JOY82_23315 [Streptosporangiaceae bacterium]|nr:hypothetical protein [Streptosporangiaceae bacterium]MBV9857412.1 hypothetical protein [Streptosporangiaceae bacterium]
MIDDAELRRMSPGERQRLARALAAIDHPDLLHDPEIERTRKLGVLVSVVSCAVLAGWIVVLVLTLHQDYKSSHWRAAWVGFDVLLLTAFAATAWAYWRERQIVILCLVITGTLLCCDAWFDLMLDLGTPDFWQSLASAVFVELPLAAVLFATARQLVLLSAQAVMRLQGVGGPVPSLWRIPLFGEGIGGTWPARYREGERSGSRVGSARG